MGSNVDAKVPPVIRTGLFLSLVLGIAAAVVIWLEIGGIEKIAALPVSLVTDQFGPDAEPSGMAWTAFATVLIYVVWGLALSTAAYVFQRISRTRTRKAKVIK